MPITVDEDFIRDVQAQLTAIRNQIVAVRAGVNPNDAAHPRGMPWNNLVVVPGGPNFTSGTSLKQRITAIGTLVDGRLAGFDQDLSRYAQGLGNILISSDNIERANESAAGFSAFLTGTPTPTGL